MAETKHCGDPNLHLMLLGLMAFFLVSCHRNESRPSFQWTEVQKRNYFVDSFAYVMGSGKYFGLLVQDSGKSFGSFIRHQYPDLHTKYYMAALKKIRFSPLFRHLPPCWLATPLTLNYN